MGGDLYIWNNTVVKYNDSLSCLHDFRNFWQSVPEEERDYYFEQKGGYLMYDYPHPMRDGDN